jgi:hypothetical protein
MLQSCRPHGIRSYNFLRLMPTKVISRSMVTNRDLTNYGQNNSKNNIQDVDLSAKCGCITRTTIVYW